MNSKYTEVDAAGGLVRDAAGNCLMIFRDGKWDLPKGHREEGEDISETAVREVMEETGLDGLEILDLNCVTQHTYSRDGIDYLKHVWWYNMKYEGDGHTTAQREEGITDAVWVRPEDIAQRLQNSYPSIIEVFHNSDLI